MKTRYTALLVVAVLLAAVFFGLWISEKQNHAELETLCQVSAAQALSETAAGENAP